MLRVLLLTIEVLLMTLIGYNLIVALFGWRDQKSPPPGTRTHRLRVVVPAHNEAKVIGGLLSDLLRQDYSGEKHELWVLADRCSDTTSQVARDAGVKVAMRSSGPEGKGPALSWYLDHHPLESDEALVVIDADNRVTRDFLGLLSDELDQGHEAIQAYLDVSNPDASPVATASALSYWASNRMVQLARANLGWTADLGGTGMCLTAFALQAAGGFGDTAAEDQELAVNLFLAGVPVHWAHHIRVRDEKPSSPAVATRQRSRWATGRRQVARRRVLKLVARASPASVDLALRLIQPSRMGVALLSGFAALASAIGAPLLPPVVWLGAASLQMLAPLPFLVREGVPGRYLVRYPILAVLPILKIPARLLRTQGWYHTPHRG